MAAKVIRMSGRVEASAIELPLIAEVSPKRQVQGGLAFVSGIVVAVSLGAIAIEGARNYSFGARGIADPTDAVISGATCATFAVLLMALPFLARYAGWKSWMRVFYAGCMAVTAYCGVAYYVDDIRTKARDAEQVTRRFEGARRELADAARERDEARADLRQAQNAADEIGENTPPAELQALADQADQKAKAEATDQKRGAKCGDVCRAAEKERDGYLRRMPDAVAKEAALGRVDAARRRAAQAQARIDAARASAETGPAEASGMAGLAGDLGGDSQRYAAIEGLVVPVAKVLGLLGAAALLDVALSVFLVSLGFGSGAPSTPAAVKPAEQPRGLEVIAPINKPPLAQRAAALFTSPKEAKRGRKPMTLEERVVKFAAERLIIGVGEMTGDEMINAFNSWSRERWPDERPMAPNKLSTLLQSEVGLSKRRSNSKSRYEASLAP